MPLGYSSLARGWCFGHSGLDERIFGFIFVYGGSFSGVCGGCRV